MKQDPKRAGIKAFVMKRVLSFGMIIVVGFLLLISFVLAAVVSACGDQFKGIWGNAGEVVVQIAQLVVGFGITWLLFALMFKFLPDTNIEWRDVWVGSAVTALLFTVGRFLIGLYLGHNTSVSAFGAAAALAILLIWIYYAALILLLGAEFTQAWAHDRGRDIGGL